MLLKHFKGYESQRSRNSTKSIELRKEDELDSTVFINKKSNQ